MKYLSKGMVLRPCTRVIVYVSHCGAEYALTGLQAKLWLEGRFKVAETSTPQQESDLVILSRMGLAEIAEDDFAAGLYRLLTKCVLVPAKLKPIRVTLNRNEAIAWRWFIGAGLNLTMAEIVFLLSKQVQPVPGLIGRENACALTEVLYDSNSIQDNLMEHEMEREPGRDHAVRTVLGLVRKKRLMLV